MKEGRSNLTEKFQLFGSNKEISEKEFLEFGKKASSTQIYYSYIYIAVVILLMFTSYINPFIIDFSNFQIYMSMLRINIIMFFLIIDGVFIKTFYKWKGNPDKLNIKNYNLISESFQNFISNPRFKDETFRAKAKKWMRISSDFVHNSKRGRIGYDFMFCMLIIIASFLEWYFSKYSLTQVLSGLLDVQIYNAIFLIIFLMPLIITFYIARGQLISNIFQWSLYNIFYQKFKWIKLYQVNITSMSYEKLKERKIIEKITRQISNVGVFINLNFFKTLKTHNYNLKIYYIKMLFDPKSNVFELLEEYINFLIRLRNNGFFMTHEYEVNGLLKSIYDYIEWLLGRVDLKKRKLYRLLEQKSQIHNSIELLSTTSPIVSKELSKRLDEMDIADILDIISKGENEIVEFKSSFRWDIRGKRVNTKLEHVIAKGISGFLNTKGGLLFIGVDENGEILGLEKDFSFLGKKDQDGFQLKLAEIVGNYIGNEIADFWKIKFFNIEDKEICVIEVIKSPEPVYTKKFKKKNGEDFYIRVGSSTTPLSMRETVKYQQHHFI